MTRPTPHILAVLILLVSSIPAAAQVTPGETITRSNVEKIRDLVSPGVFFAVENGMDMEIVEHESIPQPVVYKEATERYSAQVTLAENNNLENWVAGRPFPTIDNADPKAAVKIMWNFARTAYFTDDLNVHLPDADTGAFFVDHEGNRKYQIERHFIVDWSRRIRYFGRTRNEPIPQFDENPDETFEKAAFFPLIEPFDLKGVGTVSYRYLDAARQDDTWLYTPVIRRVRRLSSAQRSDALFGQDIDLDSFGGYAGQTQWFDWKFLGMKPMLASFHGVNLPPKVCERDGGVTYCENWEMRPEMYIVEGTPKVSNYAYSKRVIFMDKEIFLIPYTDMYDKNEELWKTVILNTRYSNRPNPNADLQYDDARLFVYGFTVLDIQLKHGTRAAIPGMQFPNEASWYVDIGLDHDLSADEDWFTVASLIRAGR